MVRDSALRVAGLLSARIGGPSVFPPQPASVTTEGTYGAIQWRASSGRGSQPSESLHIFQTHCSLPLYTTFDAPSGEACVARRDVSNTAMHALFLLNDVTFVEASQALGRTFADLPGSVDDRVEELFRRVVCRCPMP